MLFGAVLALLLLAALVLVELNLVTFAYERLGLSHRVALGLLLASLAGSAVNIPVARSAEAEVLSDRVVIVYGVPYVIPVTERWPGTILAVNLGGAVIPAMLSAYLVAEVGHAMRVLGVVALVALVTHRFARPVPGVGIVVPILIPPLVAVAAALLLASEVRAAAAYVGGTMGTLVGADLLNLGRLRGVGAPVASIGGAGTFDGIFVTGIVAVLLA
jgi:uncharacterized membrane protein